MDEKEPAAPKLIWAPWRIDYIRSPKQGGCFLCGLERQPPAGAEDDLVIARSETCFLILNRFPYNSGHLMVAPYRHVADLSALTAAERTDLTDLTIRGKDLLAAVMHPEGFNLGMNLGGAAGAGLEDHLHQHLVPRWHGDTNFMPVLANTRVVPEALEATVALLRKAWRQEKTRHHAAG
jgi:ATP adenylyltransferase